MNVFILLETLPQYNTYQCQIVLLPPTMVTSVQNIPPWPIFQIRIIPSWTISCIGNTTSLLHLSPISTSGKTSYCKISQSHEAARFVFRIIRSPWNLTGTSAALSLCVNCLYICYQFCFVKIWFQHIHSYLRAKTLMQLAICLNRLHLQAL